MKTTYASSIEGKLETIFLSLVNNDSASADYAYESISLSELQSNVLSLFYRYQRGDIDTSLISLQLNIPVKEIEEVVLSLYEGGYLQKPEGGRGYRYSRVA